MQQTLNRGRPFNLDVIEKNENKRKTVIWYFKIKYNQLHKITIVSINNRQKSLPYMSIPCKTKKNISIIYQSQPANKHEKCITSVVI